MVHIEKEMFLNIITPCSRPENLITISRSINIPVENYRWIVVFDMETLPSSELIPSNCEIYLHKNPVSIVGNSQRNYALNIIDYGHIYFNDDDTTIHPKLWENIKNLNNDFISFIQLDKELNIRLISDNVKVRMIDSHNFLVSKELIGDIKFELNKYEADGIFATECRKKSKSAIWLNKPLSIYNSLRT